MTIHSSLRFNPTFGYLLSPEDNKVISNDVNHVQTTGSTSSKEALQGYLGDANLLLDSVWPSDQLSEDESQKLVNSFIKKYRAHYDRIIKSLSELNFQEVETIWHSFWQNTDDNLGDDSGMSFSMIGFNLLCACLDCQNR